MTHPTPISTPRWPTKRLPLGLLATMLALLASLTATSADTLEVTGRIFTDLNENGLRDTREPGVPNVRVDLLNPKDEILAHTLSTPTGAYALKIPGTPNAPDVPSQYRVRFDKKTLPGGFDFTTWKTGDDPTLDSDAHPFSGVSPRFDADPALTALPPIDAGIRGGGSIAGVVWNDQNVNGLIEGEPKLDGTLIDCFAITKTNIAFVSRARTNAEGYYTLSALPAGLYLLELRKRTAPLPRLRLTTDGAKIIKLKPRETRRGANFGLTGLGPAALIGDFTARESFRDANAVDLSWTTAAELDPLAFRVLRSTSRTGPRIPVAGGLIPARDHTSGAAYTATDTNASGPAEEYFYWIETLDTDFVATTQGPFGLAQQIAAEGRIPLGETGLTLLAIPDGRSYEVRVNGVVVPSVVTSRGLLARVPPNAPGGPTGPGSEPDIEVLPAIDPDRMALVDAYPVGVSFESVSIPLSGYTRLPTPVEAERYLVIGNGGSLYAVDLQDPESPKLLDAPVLSEEGLPPALYLSIPENSDVIVMEEPEEKKASSLSVRPR